MRNNRKILDDVLLRYLQFQEKQLTELTAFVDSELNIMESFATIMEEEAEIFKAHMKMQDNLISWTCKSEEGQDLCNQIQKYDVDLVDISDEFNFELTGTSFGTDSNSIMYVLGESNIDDPDKLKSLFSKIRIQYKYISCSDSNEKINEIFKKENRNIMGVVGLYNQENLRDLDMQYLEKMFLLSKLLMNYSKNNLMLKKELLFWSISFGNTYLGYKAINTPTAAVGVSGLIKTMNKEAAEKINCKIIEIDQMNSNDCVLDKMLLYSGKRVEFFFTNSKVFSTYLKLSASNDKTHPLINKKDKFLVIGGAKGITATCIKELAKTHQCDFLLVGSTHLEKITEREEDVENIRKRVIWLARKKNEKINAVEMNRSVKKIQDQKQMQQNISEMISLGSSVEYIQCDITDIDQVSRLPIQGITGIIFGAGIIQDNLIVNKSIEEFCKVYRVKYRGLTNILSVVNIAELHHLVLFSSISGFFGNEGQADYASANEFLNYMARHIKYSFPNCNILSLNWGPWEIGMVDSNIKKIMEEKGLTLIQEDVGKKYFIDSICYKSNVPQVVINSKENF